MPQDRFAFLGYDFGRYYSAKTGRAYLCAQPSKKSVQRMIGRIREATERRVLWLDAETIAKRLNRMLIGWAHYSSGRSTRRIGRSILHPASASPVAMQQA
jgi:RNA-directed DNA polymerase